MSLRRHAGLTLLEVVISITILLAILGLAFGGLDSTAKTATVVSSMTDAQLRAETLLRDVCTQLRGAAATGPSAIVITDPAGKAIAVEFSPVDLGAPIFDPADPYKAPFTPGVRRVLRFEASPGEALDDGADNDRDGRVDEGQLALYVRGAPDQLIAVLAQEVNDFTVTLDANPSPYPRLWVSVTAEQRLPVAPGPDGAVGTARHVARGMVTLLN